MKILTKILSLLSITLLAHAQENIRTDLMAIAIGSDVSLHYSHKGEIKKIDMLQSSMGTPVFYKGPKELLLFSKPPVPVAAGEKPQLPLAQVSLPDARRVLLLAITGPDKKTLLRAYPIKDDALSEGNYRVYNISRKQVVGLMGQKNFSIASGAFYDVRENEFNAKQDLGAQFAWVDEQKKQHLAYSTVWGHSAKARYYIFLLDTNNPQQPLEVRKFHDVPSVPSLGYEKEPAAR